MELLNSVMMRSKPVPRRVLLYTIYAVIGTIIEMCILMAILLWGLPAVDINLPVWAIVLLAILMLAYSYYTYRMGRKALSRKLLHEMEAMIGVSGFVVTEGGDNCYIKIRGELWKSLSDTPLIKGEEVVVVSVNGFKLVVESKRQ